MANVNGDLGAAEKKAKLKQLWEEYDQVSKTMEQVARNNTAEQQKQIAQKKPTLAQ